MKQTPEERAKKRSDFLYAVQTAMIINSVRLATDRDREDKKELYSTSWAISTVDYVLYAADRIPEDMTAMEAVHEFCDYYIENLREAEPEGQRPSVPYWCARH